MKEEPPNRDNWPTVGIVILNWENYEDTAKCLSSLKSITYPNYKCFVVDNGSTDGSGERIDDEFEWVEVVYNDENLGAAAGNNSGVQRAMDDGVDYVLCLNEDTVLFPNFLHPLVETMETRKRVAVVGGRHYNPETETGTNAGVWFVPSLGGRTTTQTKPLRGTSYGSGMIPPFFALLYVPTSMVLINPEFIKDHDVFCEDYFLGMEDVDMAYQAARDDWKVLVNPESQIYHKEGKTMEWSPFKTYHWFRNRFQFATNRLPLYSRLPFQAMLWVTLAWFCLQWFYRGDVELIRAAFIGVGDYITDADFREYEFFA